MLFVKNIDGQFWYDIWQYCGVQYNFKMRTLIVVMTGVCGKIAYSLFNSLGTGFVFGYEIEIDLRLIDVESKKQALTILKEELLDCCFSKVKKITIYTDKDEDMPYHDADVCIFLGAVPRKPGQDRNDVFQQNAAIFQKQGRYLDKYAKKTCKSLVVANPTCTNCLVLAHNAPSIPKSNFTALTRLDFNRFLGQTAKYFNVKPSQITHLVVWGNHSRKQLWDASRIQVEGLSKEQVKEKMKDLDVDLLEKEMYERGGFIQQKTKGNAYISATKAIADHLKDWFQGSDRPVSMGIIVPQNMYNVPSGLCFSMPTLCVGGGQYKVIEDIKLNEDQYKRFAENLNELEKEMEIVAQYLPGSIAF